MVNSENKTLKTFLSISIYLTGFSEVELLGTGMLETYYNTLIVKKEPQVTNWFFDEAERIVSLNNKDKINQAIANVLMLDSTYSDISKRIITMWYMGTWNQDGLDEVISPESYIEAMVWGIAGTHPPGAKQPGFDSWSKKPLD